jgi:hypothetical protein
MGGVKGITFMGVRLFFIALNPILGTKLGNYELAPKLLQSFLLPVSGWPIPQRFWLRVDAFDSLKTRAARAWAFITAAGRTRIIPILGFMSITRFITGIVTMVIVAQRTTVTFITRMVLCEGKEME